LTGLQTSGILLASAEISHTNLEDKMATWTIEDFQLLIDLVANGRMVLVADTSLGLPTIHDFSGAEHIGFGYFTATNPQYTVDFEGGGAMSRTPSGKGYSCAKVVKGTFEYPTEDVLDKLEALMVNAPTLEEN
jgi:hypothetical protein